MYFVPYLSMDVKRLKLSIYIEATNFLFFFPSPSLLLCKRANLAHTKIETVVCRVIYYPWKQEDFMIFFMM